MASNFVFLEGKRAAEAGKMADECPYSDEYELDLYNAWMDGFESVAMADMDIEA